MEILVRTNLFLIRILSWIVFPIFWLLSLRKGEKVSPITNRLLFLSATTLADKIRKQEIKSETVVEAYINRIKEVNPLLNAVVEERFDDALQEAREIDKYLNATTINIAHLEATQPLLGVPITVKESCGVQVHYSIVACSEAGNTHSVFAVTRDWPSDELCGSALRRMRQTCGSLLRVGFRATKDGAAVSRIRKAGGIILLVSNTPEYCVYWESNNNVTGRTKNPYNTHYSAAGSSGGEGALLGAGASIIGIGSDIAGSIRLPALLNGVFGHKGSACLVPLEGHIPSVISDHFKSSLVIGPMVRYAEDLSLVFKVLTAQNDLDVDKVMDLTKLKVFYMHDAGPSIERIRVDDEIKQAINKCVEHLRHVGCSNVEHFKFGIQNAMEITCALFMYSMDVPNILCNPISQKQTDWLLIELLKSPFGYSKYSTNGLLFSILKTVRGFLLPSRRNRYQRECEELKIQFEEKLKTNGVLLYPSFPTSSYQHNQFFFKISGLPFQSIFNIVGLPCINVPLGIAKNAMPIGIQVVAGPKQDRLCFAVAKELEKAFGGWSPPA